MSKNNIEFATKSKWNEQFAKMETSRAIQAVEVQVAHEKQQQNMSCEMYHELKNPFEIGTDEHAYIQELLGGGSGRDADYIDLFSRLQDALKLALEAEHVHAFFLINCRFDAQREDNFLLYVLVSWGG